MASQEILQQIMGNDLTYIIEDFLFGSKEDWKKIYKRTVQKLNGMFCEISYTRTPIPDYELHGIVFWWLWACYGLSNKSNEWKIEYSLVLKQLKEDIRVSETLI